MERSAPFAGNSQDGELTLDWGINAALLFGRQRTKTHHQTTVRYAEITALNPLATNHSLPHAAVSQHPLTQRDRAEYGWVCGLSFAYHDAKISFGYRADFFFGAIDGGIDARKNENRGFMGPYASISIGLGD